MATLTEPVIQELKLDMTHYEIVVAYAKQYEKNVTKLLLNLYDKGIKLDIDYKSSISLKGKKPDGKVLVYEYGQSDVITLGKESNQIMIDVVQQMTVADGRVAFQLEVITADRRKFTATFYLRVHKAAMPEDAVKSDNYYLDLKESILIADEAYKKEMEEMIESLQGTLVPKGSVNTVYELPNLDESVLPGYTYDVKTGFTVDPRFVDFDPTLPLEEQKYYSDGTNVYLTMDRQWDALSGTMSMEETEDIDFHNEW